ncbi:MAG: VCBS repeat-containing protein [Verrucomicrobia bacterium]|nr:VCBS repeat-containing protein [Verrucomicrobiota bacterium]
MFPRFLIGVWLFLASSLVQAQTTSFTYQGRLEDDGNPVTGLYDFEFHLYSTEQGEPAFASPLSLPRVGVTNGLFSVLLDFGPQFNGGAQYLEVRVRPAGNSGAYAVLRPRQQVTAAPYASRAGSVLGPISASQLPPSVLLENKDAQLVGRLEAVNPNNRFGGDGSRLTGVLAAGLGAGAEVRFQSVFFRRLAEAKRDGLREYWSSGVVAGDFNGDSKPDLLVSLAGISVANLYTNTGNGELKQSSHSTSAAVFSPKFGVTGDFNADGKLDLAWLDGRLLRVSTNHAGNLVGMTDIPMTNVTALIAMDVNSDGLTDLAVADFEGDQSRVQLVLSSGTGLVRSAMLLVPSPVADLVAGDLNGDGRPELVAACSRANQLRVFRNNAGTLQFGADVSAVNPVAVARGTLGDIVGNSSPGLSYVSDSGFNNGRFEDSMIRTLIPAGNLLFQPSSTVVPLEVTSAGQTRLILRDFNSDLRLDAVAVIPSGFAVGQISFFASIGSSAVPSLVGSWGWSGVTDLDVADFNGDQIPDFGTGTIQGAQVWVRDGSGVTTRSYAQFEGGVGVQGTILASGGLDVAGPVNLQGRTRTQQVEIADQLQVAGSTTLASAAVSDELSFGRRTRQMLNLWGTEYGVGVQSSSMYFRSAGDYLWFQRGVHDDAQGNPGAGGERLMSLSSSGLTVSANDGTLALGEFGSESTAPRIDFVRGATRPSGYDVRLINDPPGTLQLQGNSTISGALGFGTQTRQMLNLWGVEYGLGVQSSSMYFRSSGDFLWFRRGVHADAQGNPGVGGARLMRLTSEGRLGLGIESPAYSLDVEAGAGVARLSSTNGGFGSVLVLRNSTPSPQYLGAINFETADSTVGQIGYLANDQMTFRVAGSQRMVIDSSGNMAITGAFAQASDRNAKENLRPVDPVAVLEKVVSLPLSEWNYRQDPGTRHLGPMAQDFHAAFGVGPDDRHITTVDADGVALAAIQGLNQKLEEARQENEELRARLDRLERMLEARNGK